MSEINMQQKLLSEFNNAVGVFKARLAESSEIFIVFDVCFTELILIFL